MYNSNQVDYLKEKNIVIYGAGFIAQEFWNALINCGLSQYVKEVCVTQISKSSTEFNGYKIKTIDQIVLLPNSVVCIACHESVLGEMEKELIYRGIEDYMWVSPQVIFEMNLGKPLEIEKKISVQDLVKNTTDYGLAIRILAIKEMDGESKGGIEIYKKYIKYFSSEDAAQKRVLSFTNMYRSWKEEGYTESSVVVIDENKVIIDGCHRVAMAYYFDNDYVVANIYRNAASLIESRNKAFPKEIDLMKMGLTEYEKTIVVNMYSHL